MNRFLEDTIDVMDLLDDLSDYLAPAELADLKALSKDTTFLQETVLGCDRFFYADVMTMSNCDLFEGFEGDVAPDDGFGVYIEEPRPNKNVISLVLGMLAMREQNGVSSRALVRTGTGTRLITCCSSKDETDGSFSTFEAEADKIFKVMQAGGAAWADYKASMQRIGRRSSFKKHLLPERAL